LHVTGRLADARADNTVLLYTQVQFQSITGESYM